MTASPASLLTKLDELKKWQQTQQERLMKNHFLRIEKTDNSIAALGKDKSIDISPILQITQSKQPKFEAVQQNKTNNSPKFEKNSIKEQTVNELLFKNAQQENYPKPKQPYLKRGAGLVKFGMKPGEQKYPFNKKTTTRTKPLQRKQINHNKEIKNPLKLSPLKPPKLEIKPGLQFQNFSDFNDKSDDEPPQKHEVEIISHINELATKRAEYNNKIDKEFPQSYGDEIISEINELAKRRPEYNNKSADKLSKGHEVEILSNNNELVTKRIEPKDNTLDNSFLFEQISKLANEKFGESSLQNSLHTTEILNQINKLVAQGKTLDLENNQELVVYLQGLLEKCGAYSDTSSNQSCNSPVQSQCGDITAYERGLERDLLEFERVENKIMNNSFNSTTSLLMELLQSTPRYEKKGEIIRDGDREEGGAKKMLQFCDVVESDESSVTSDDLEDKTMNEEGEEEESTNCRTTSSTSSHSMKVITKQNAAVMTDLSISQLTTDEELKSKISELDKEIRSFRLENKKLQNMQRDVEKIKRELEISKKKLNRELQDERIKMEFDLEEDKKKLSKERLVFERYVKDQQTKMSKKEREDISNLKTEVANLNEALKLKDTRNGTTQARLRNQVKSLEKDNTNLKDEIAKLQKQNAKLLANQKVGRKSNETKMLQEINKNITKLTQEAGKKKVDKSDNEREIIEKENDGKNKNKRTPDELEEEEIKGTYSDFFEYNEKNCRSRQHSESKSSKDEIDDSFIYSPSYKHQRSRIKSLSDSYNDISEKENDRNKSNFDVTTFRNLNDLSLENNYEKIFGSRDRKQRNNSLNDTQASSSGKIEKVLLDGSKEIKYPNGNVKLISPDGNFISMKYYNGDVKETKLLDGSVKYFYSETQIWQTTLANGDEILEFTDGQLEKKYSNGSCDVVFPNGVIKHTDIDGVEKITYPDGSVVSVNNDEKILLLPNGQKEIHTKEHKRREYPDGTVKLLYPDGLQETRYSNGRIRMKDKDGNLLMDTHGDDL